MMNRRGNSPNVKAQQPAGRRGVMSRMTVMPAGLLQRIVRPPTPAAYRLLKT